MPHRKVRLIISMQVQKPEPQRVRLVLLMLPQKAVLPMQVLMRVPQREKLLLLMLLQKEKPVQKPEPQKAKLVLLMLPQKVAHRKVVPQKAKPVL